MERVMIDFIGTLIGISVTMMFYGTVWAKRTIKWYISYGGILLIAAISTSVTALLQSTVFLTVVIILLTFILSLYFESGISSKILFTFIITAILFVAEQFVGIVFVYFIRIPIEVVQSSTTLYMVGVITSKLLVILIVFVIRVFMKGYKRKTDNQFNLIMAFMPVQSIIICLVVSSYSINTGATQVDPLGITAILISLALVYLTMILIKNQQNALQCKRAYDLSQKRLDIQIEHYENLYITQREVRAIRHNISDNLVAISGLLEKEKYSEALDFINKINTDVKRTAEIICTEHPSIDAVIDAKIAKARECDIQIEHKIWIDNKMLADQFDVASLIANALDNAIEGILRSSEVERCITLNLNSTSDYISMIVENYSTGPVYGDFRTSKKDKINHGFGMEHMKEITKKYDGDAYPKYNPETHKFTLKILLKNKPA